MLKEAIVPSRVITSNTVFVLTEILKEILSQKEGTLRTVVITPGNCIKNFITQHLTDSMGGFFGLRFLTLPQAVEHFMKLAYPENFSFPSLSNLALHIESLLENRSSHHAHELAHIFLYYGIYGGESLKRWEKEEGWQQNIWREISKTWNFPCHIMQQKPEPKFPIQVISFHLSHVPPLYRAFLDDLPWPTTHLFRTPTPLYWGDLLSNKALAKSDNLFQKKAVSISERTSFEEIASDANSLLANFGGMGKSTFLWLSEKECLDAFIPPKEDSALSQIQSDIFSINPCRKLAEDSSLEIHEAPSLLREVEILLENLKTIPPEDVIVLSVDLDLYFPYIQYVFDNSPLGYALTSLSSLPYNPHLKQIDLFFSLINSRFEADLVRKFVNLDDFPLLDQIIEEMNIEWGFDHEMKQELLGLSHISERGSWRFAFQHILESLPFSSSFEISEFEELGNHISFLETLFTDLRAVKKREESPTNWTLLLEDLLRKYLPESDELEFVIKELHTLKPIEALFPFSSIHTIIHEILRKHTFDKYSSGKPTIQFATLADGCMVEKKVVYLLGLDEENFPRKRTHRSLNEIKGTIGADHQPENGEKDRFFFLEALLSAREKLIISYTGSMPSFCVQELSYPFIKKHPLFIFHPKKKETITFTPILTQKPSLEIDVRHLIELVRHPIRFYCNRILGIYLEKPLEKNSREFFLSYLDRAKASEALLYQTEEELFTSLEKKNKLPTALFFDAAKQELQKEMEEMEIGFKTFGIAKSDFFSLHLDKLCTQETELSENRLVRPAIRSHLPDGTPFTLFGKLPSITKQGLYIHKKFSLAEVWKYLPHIALLSPNLFFGKDGTLKTPTFPLISLIEYYRDATMSASPLLPDQAERILKNKGFSFDDEDPYLSFNSPDLSKPWEDVCKNLIV